MSSTWRLAIVIQYEPEVKERNLAPIEQHFAEKCKYRKGLVVPLLDKKQTNQSESEILDIHPEYWCKTNGIEVHLKGDCRWDQREQCFLFFSFQICFNSSIYRK